MRELFNKEPKYRLAQAEKALFCDLIQNWDEATALPSDFRKELNEKCPLNISAEIFISKDKNTAKALFTLKDRLKVEAVLMRHKDGRNTVCVSSQAGCPLGCSFCATGKIGFKRNLGVWEIIEQVLFFARLLAPERSDGGQARYLKKSLPDRQAGLPAQAGGEKVGSIVFMGMGEPFLNYQNVMEAIKILNDKDGFNLGARHFSISTVGIVEGIRKLAEEKLQINLAISLHAPDDNLRSELMPINKKYPIKEILKAADDYIKKTRRRVMFEYIMIKDLNDSAEHAEALAGIMKKHLYFVNLISYNATGIFKPSSPLRIKKFKEILEKEKVAVTERYRFGGDIDAACGQLAVRGKCI
ncbi:MAG: 23S rRNA (adenine(2503)-C(2))-methyltransferase RlmN [bacterium]|nr:23S rRNA (adenine(2503)-C(2))-methyltransferase RlmN [bacterium]